MTVTLTRTAGRLFRENIRPESGNLQQNVIYFQHPGNHIASNSRTISNSTTISIFWLLPEQTIGWVLQEPRTWYLSLLPLVQLNTATIVLFCSIYGITEYLVVAVSTLPYLSLDNMMDQVPAFKMENARY